MRKKTRGDNAWAPPPDPAGQYTVFIERWHPATINQLLGAHRFEASRLKRSDAQIIGTYACKANVPKATGKRSVELLITLGKGQRAADVDAYHKSLLDGLVNLGYLKDDNRQWLDLLPVKFDRALTKATTITIREVI